MLDVLMSGAIELDAKLIEQIVSNLMEFCYRDEEIGEVLNEFVDVLNEICNPDAFNDDTRPMRRRKVI